ncbi:MAG: hypothetical protein V4471_07645 [Pseudomonadota bacterium]
MPTTSLYPDLNELLSEELKQLERFINFPKANEIFQKTNEQLRQLKDESVNFDRIETQLKIDSFFQEIKILVENEKRNLRNLVSLVDAYCDNEPEKQELNYLISLQKKRLTNRFDSLEVFNPDDLDILNDLIKNKSNKFLVRIKEVFNSFNSEYQYEEYKQSLLEKFNFLQDEDAHAKFKIIISEWITFKDSHEIFQSLLRTKDFYKNQRTSIDEVQLNSEKITLIKDDLDALEKKLFLAIYEFNPLVKPVSDLQLELNYGFDRFNSKLIELKEANKLALRDELNSLKEGLVDSIKAPAYTFTSVLLKSDDLLEDIANLSEEVQTISEEEDGFNEYYKRYLALKSEISELTIFSFLKAPFDKMFTKKTEQRINEISAYKDKLHTLVDSMANKKAKIFNFILKELQDIKDFEHDDTKLGSSTLAKSVSGLVATLDENISTLSKHRNTPFKSAFWCLFGVFRPATTSLQLIKEIKEELNQFNSSIQGKISSPTP